MNTHRAPRIGLLLFLSLFAGFPAVAGNWKLVVDDNKTRVEIDVASLRFEQDGNIAKAWERETHSKPEQATPGDFFFTSSKTLAQYHCTNRTTTYLYRAYFAADGSEIRALAATDLGKVDFLIPDSLNERKLIFACTYKPAAKKPVPLPEQTDKSAEPTATASKPTKDKVAEPPATASKPTKDKAAEPAATASKPTKDKAAEPPASATQPTPVQPAEKGTPKAAPPAKSAAKGGKPPVEGKPEMAETNQPEATKQFSQAPAGKTPAGK